MKKTLIILFLAFLSISSYAHQPELASFIYSKTDDGKHIIQLNGALTGIETEIHYTYSKDAYKTPDEFKELVIDHFIKNISFIINEKEVKLINPLVILGHETKLIVEAIDIPDKIESIKLKNTFFKNVPNNKLTVLFLSDNFPKEKYVLNNENHHTIDIRNNDGKWTAKKDNCAMMNLGLTTLIILVLGGGYYMFRRKRTLR